MASLSLAERRHFEEVNIDPALAGAIIGVGAQSAVRRYGEGQVVKTPLYQVYNTVYAQTVGRGFGQTYDAANHELDLCRESFEPFVVDTEIRANADRQKFCIVQPMLSMRKQTFELFMTDSVHEKLSHLVECNRKMIADHHMWFDMMSFNSAALLELVFKGKPFLGNIAVDTKENPDLRLFDLGVYPMPQQSRFPAIFRHVMSVQKWNMSKFGLDFGG